MRTLFTRPIEELDGTPTVYLQDAAVVYAATLSSRQEWLEVEKEFAQGELYDKVKTIQLIKMLKL